MAEFDFPMPNGDMTQEETLNLIAKMSKTLNWLLNNLDSKNVKEINADIVNVTNLKAGSIKTGELVVGTNVEMGANAYISWGNVTEQPSIPTQYTNMLAVAAWVASGYKTYIDANGVYTGAVAAQNIIGSNISTIGFDGSGDYIDMQRQYLSFWDNANPLIPLNKMTLGFIKNKDNVNVPGIVFGAGDGYGDNRGYIQKDTDGLSMFYIGDLSAGEISYIKLMKDKAQINGYDIFSKQTAIGDSYLASGAAWNNKLSEMKADGTKFSGKISQDLTTNENTYLDVDSSTGHLYLFKDDVMTFGVQNLSNHEIALTNYGMPFLNVQNSGTNYLYPTVYPGFDWDFSSATVTGIVAKFA